MKRFLSLLGPLVLLLAISCKDTSTNPGSLTVQSMFLESEYVNFAWGYSHYGRFIDTSGLIISYDIGRSGEHWTPNPSGYYTEAELRAKIHHNDTLRGIVPADTLDLLRALGAASVGGAFSDTTCPGADMGAFVLSCYIFQEDSSKFRRIVLRVDGDCRYHNTSKSAIELANWLAKQ
jgi:hypothetical protein